MKTLAFDVPEHCDAWRDLFPRTCYNCADEGFSSRVFICWEDGRILDVPKPCPHCHQGTQYFVALFLAALQLPRDSGRATR